MSGYRDLEIYQSAFQLAQSVHFLTLKLPKYELFEQGSQLRRSSKSIVSNIAEGYGRRTYKAEFIRFLMFAQASCDEASSQLHMLQKTHPQLTGIEQVLQSYDQLGKKINLFIQYVRRSWK